MFLLAASNVDVDKGGGLATPCIVICLAVIATQLENISSKKATKMQAALILRMNTAPAAQSLAILMLGCRPGCR